MTSETQDQIKARDEKKMGWKKLVRNGAIAVAVIGANTLGVNAFIETHQRMDKLEQENMGLRYKITQV